MRKNQCKGQKREVKTPARRREFEKFKNMKGKRKNFESERFKEKQEDVSKIQRKLEKNKVSMYLKRQGERGVEK